MRSGAEGANAFFKKHQNEIIASQVGNQYLLSSSTQLAAARASAASGNYVPLAWFVFNVDLIAGEGGTTSTFYEDERQGRTRRVAVALERSDTGAVTSLAVPSCGTFTFEYDGNELVGYDGPDSRCVPDVEGAPTAKPTRPPPTPRPSRQPTREPSYKPTPPRAEPTQEPTRPSTEAPVPQPTTLACADDPTGDNDGRGVPGRRRGPAGRMRAGSADAGADEGIPDVRRASQPWPRPRPE